MLGWKEDARLVVRCDVGPPRACTEGLLTPVLLVWCCEYGGPLV